LCGVASPQTSLTRESPPPRLVSKQVLDVNGPVPRRCSPNSHRLSQYNWHNWPRKQLAAHFILEVQAVKVFGASSAENLTSAMPCYVPLCKIPKLPQPPSLASMAFQCFDDFSAIAAMYGDSTEFCCVSLEFDRFMGRTDHTLHHSGVCLQTPIVFSSFNCC